MTRRRGRMLGMIHRHAVHALLEPGRKQREIAEWLGIPERTVRRIAKERRWRRARMRRSGGSEASGVRRRSGRRTGQTVASNP